MPVARPYPFPGGESYAAISENPFHAIAKEPLSTFSIDVDTASYSNVRRFLTAGTLPPAEAVRVEEMINYFRYQHTQPAGDTPFSVTTELTECPWNPRHKLALIALQGRQLPSDNLPARNLVFLIDVSGSMASPDKLPLIRSALRMFADTLTSRDRVAIVVYAGSSGLVLPSVPGDHRGAIHRAIAELDAGGSTNGGQGIQLAYRVARTNFIAGGVNRVILATDGDFNVGITSHAALVTLIERERASGVFLSVLGVGTGNLKDATMEMLADKGNGNYAYLDSLQEARKVLIQEGGSTLVTIAKDVKLQVEFNPRHVAGYRLIGYENRLLRPEDFNDDKKDAGEIGAGHTVTALYEIVPAGSDLPGPSVDPLRYQAPPPPVAQSAGSHSNELLTVKLRYKQPEADDSRLITRVIENRAQPMSANVGFASAVAEIGMLLRDSPHAPAASFDAAIARARKFRGADDDGHRMEFVKLAETAASLKRLQQTAPR
jgi:Ca-activated chloride channel homolog